MMEPFLRCLRAGDTKSAMTFWRSKRWTDTDRDAARRLLATARDVAAEVLP